MISIMEQNYSPEDLEKQYAPSQWTKLYSPDEVMEIYEKFSRDESVKVTKNFPDMMRLSYGDTEEQKLDIFGHSALPKDAPIFVYVHGGYWIYGSLKDSRFFVPPFYEAGIVSAVLGYDLVSESVTVPDIISQVRKGIHTLLEYAHKRGSRGIYICGHSVGAHLITAALSAEKEGVNYDIIKGVIASCGLYDLHSILPTTNGPAARLTKEIADKCSPLTTVKKLKENLSPNTNILVSVAEYESNCFLQHSEVYAKALKDEGMCCEFFVVKNEDHFTHIMKLGNPKFVITEKIIKLIASHGKN